MPHLISVDPEHGHVLCRAVGVIDDDETYAAWRAFYEGPDWTPGMPELIDMSALERADVTSRGQRRLAEYVGELFTRHGVAPRTAVYCPTPLSWGLARMYATNADHDDSPEHSVLFRDLEEALAHLAADPGRPDALNGSRPTP